MDDFPSNSRNPTPKPVRPVKSADTKPEKLEQITTGEVVKRKKPLGRKFKETFGGDNARSVWSYVVSDVLIPAAKDMIADATSSGVERTLFGDSYRGRSGRSRGNSGPNGYVSYNYSRPNGASPAARNDARPMSHRSRANHDFDEIVLESRAEATEVIDRLFSLISQYDMATVADLYDLVGVLSSHTDNKWGWTDIRGADVTRVRNGYLLNLPQPGPLD